MRIFTILDATEFRSRFVLVFLGAMKVGQLMLWKIKNKLENIFKKS